MVACAFVELDMRILRRRPGAVVVSELIAFLSERICTG
jgi:hypothetical protein